MYSKQLYLYKFAQLPGPTAFVNPRKLLTQRCPLNRITYSKWITCILRWGHHVVFAWGSSNVYGGGQLSQYSGGSDEISVPSEPVSFCFCFFSSIYFLYSFLSPLRSPFKIKLIPSPAQKNAATTSPPTTTKTVATVPTTIFKVNFTPLKTRERHMLAEVWGCCGRGWRYGDYVMNQRLLTRVEKLRPMMVNKVRRTRGGKHRYK